MTNREARKEVERLYGKGCFMERAGIRVIDPLEEQLYKKRIKGFKKLDRNVTFHHLRYKSNRWKSNYREWGKSCRL